MFRIGFRLPKLIKLNYSTSTIKNTNNGGRNGNGGGGGGNNTDIGILLGVGLFISYFEYKK